MFDRLLSLPSASTRRLRVFLRRVGGTASAAEEAAGGGGGLVGLSTLPNNCSAALPLTAAGE
jgi:hypothetical protein